MRWYLNLNTHGEEFNFFVPHMIQLIVDVGSGRGTSATEAVDRASPEQIERLWKQYLLAQIVG